MPPFMIQFKSDVIFSYSNRIQSNIEANCVYKVSQSLS